MSIYLKKSPANAVTFTGDKVQTIIFYNYILNIVTLSAGTVSLPFSSFDSPPCE